MSSKNAVHHALDVFFAGDGMCTEPVSSASPCRVEWKSQLDPMAATQHLHVTQSGPTLAALDPSPLPLWKHCWTTSSLAAEDSWLSGMVTWEAGKKMSHDVISPNWGRFYD